MTQEDEIAALQNELKNNPKFPQFARLADLYLARDMNEEAEALVKQSLKYHPRSISGLVIMGRIYKLKKMYTEALVPLSDAIKLAPENWRAWLETAEAQLELKNGKAALAAFKKVLFFNPMHPLARRAVAKLELLTADEYEDDLFQLKKLPDTVSASEPKPAAPNIWTKPDDALIRVISFVDALIVRHEYEKALALLNEWTVRNGPHPEIETRRLRLSVYEKAAFLQPKSAVSQSQTKQKIINEKKIAALRMLLRRIGANKSDLLST